MFVRKTFKNLLPHPTTLKTWYSVVDGNLGFTKEAFETIQLCVKQSPQPIICNICIDEMSIRKQISYLNGKFYGRVDLSTSAGEDCEDFDNTQEATNALIFLAVCVNGYWKVPLGYFLIHSLCGSETANLLTKGFKLLRETGVICHSITCDGTTSNLSMCTSLG